MVEKMRDRGSHNETGTIAGKLSLLVDYSPFALCSIRHKGFRRGR